MTKLVSALMQEVLQLKMSGASKLHIQLLQQKIDKIARQTSDTQKTRTNSSSTTS